MATKKKTKKKLGGRRTVVKRRGKSVYAKRNKKGQFKDIQSISRATKADRRKKSKTKLKTKKKGFGWKGDY